MANPIEYEAPFRFPGVDKPCKTWYSVYGNLQSGITPLICIPGGPGMPSDYILSFADLATSPPPSPSSSLSSSSSSSSKPIPVVIYDQIGCGRSTSLREKADAGPEFWHPRHWVAELENLVSHLKLETFDLIGHSWGAMVAATAAAAPANERFPGLRRLVLANPLASAALWMEAQNRLLADMPDDVRTTIREHDERGDWDAKPYQAALSEFQASHMYRRMPWPKEVIAAAKRMDEDPTMMKALNGPSEFRSLGAMKDWGMSDDEIRSIKVPTLLMNGRYDQAQDSVIAPFFSGISKIKWAQFSESSHMPHWEERERFIEVVRGFLAAK